MHILIFISVVVSSFLAHAAPGFIHQNPEVCDGIINSKQIVLSELIQMGLIEQRAPYLYSLVGAPEDHEFKTAELLASRLKKTFVILPHLGRNITIPAVDGIIFDQDGHPTQNVSLKTFLRPDQKFDLNTKLLFVLKNARDKIEKNYTSERWKTIISGYLPASLSEQDRDRECRTYTKLFGLLEGRKRRPVMVVIDYSNDAAATFSLNTLYNEDKPPETYLTLDASGDSIDVPELMESIRKDPIVSDYVLIGAHNIFHFRKDSHKVTECCGAPDHVCH